MTEAIPRNEGLAYLAEQALRDLIARAAPGDKLPTERELSGRLGVSIAKVREALTLLAREGTVERRHGRGTFVGAGPAGRWTAVVLIHDLAHPTLSFYERSVFQSVRRRLNAAGIAARGYAAFGGVSSYDPLECAEFLDDLAAHRIRHVVPVGGDLSPDVVATLDRRGIGRTFLPEQLTMARAHDMVTVGVKYLVDQGRRRLALLSWGGGKAPVAAQYRTPVFKAALASAGLPFREDWVKCDLHPNLAGAGWQEFRDVWHSRSGKPDGLLVLNDVLAADAAIAIAEIGIRVPGDLLVVTHENRGSGQWFPFPVARLQVDPDRDAAALAAQAAAALGVRLEDGVVSEGDVLRLVPLEARGRRNPTTAVVSGRA